MKKNLTLIAMLVLLVSLPGCGGNGKESASSIAKKWCGLNARVHKAEGAEKEAAQAERRKFENDIDARYKGDEAFLKEVEKEVNKCEDASEGK